MLRQPTRQRLVGLDATTRKDQLLGKTHRRRPGKPLSGSPARHDAEVDFGLTKDRIFRADPNVTRERHLRAATKRIAIDGCNRRGLHRLEQPSTLMAKLGVGTGFERRLRGHLANIRTRDEGFVAGARQDQTTNRGVACDRSEF